MRTLLKIVYVSNPYYLDYDLSLIKNLSGITDCYYYLDISPVSYQATVMDIRNYRREASILDDSNYNILEQFSDYLPAGKTFIINRKTNKPSYSNLKLQFKLARHIRNINPDLIHFNTDFSHNFFLLRFLLKIPVVCTIHDPLPHIDNDSIKERLKRLAFYPLVKNFILLNQHQKELFIRKFRLYKKNIFTSSLGIYDYLLFNNKIKSRKRFSGQENKVRILFFGRINKYKGLPYLLEAFKGTLNKYPSASLMIAGKGEPGEVEINDTENVTFINRYIENSELASFISDSDFVVCPYIDATQSGVVMTSFAFAKPVIATDVGGLKEFVEDGVTGLLIPPADSEKLENAILRLIENPSLIDQMSQNIIEKYHTGNSSWKAIALNTIDIYNKIISH